MTFRLPPEQVKPAWATLKIEVVYAPKTGSIKPWEVYGCFSYPFKFRKIWGSFKTEEAAMKKVAKVRKNYPQAG